MKIVNGEEIYVQNQDLKFITKAKREKEIPNIILNDLKGDNSQEIADDPKKYRVFSGKNIIDFFNSLDFIIDYEKVKNLSWAQTVSVGGEVIIELNKVQNRLNSLSTDVNNETQQYLSNRLEILKYKLQCIKEIMEEKRGNIVYTYSMIKGRKHNSPFSKVLKKNR